jgi:FkbM family methyltransferase
MQPDEEPLIRRGHNAPPMPATLSRATAAITRRYPLCSGCGAIANTRLLRALTPTEKELWVPLRDGGRMRIRPDDWIGRSIYFFGDFDPKVSWVLRRLLRPGDTAIDIGANLGLVSFIAARLVGPAGAVHAFEPQPDLAALMRRTADDTGLAHICINAVALSHQRGRLRMTVPPDNAGAARLNAAADVRGRHVEVPVETLDNAWHGSRPVRLMKLDVEGHEESVLRGATRLLQEIPPEVILFESHDRRAAQERPVVQILARAGYRFADIPRAIVRPRARWVGKDGRATGHDLLAIHSARGADAAERLGLLPSRRVTVQISAPEPVSAARD